MALREANKTFDFSCALYYSLRKRKRAKLEVVGAKGMLSNLHMFVLIVVDDCYGKALNITRMPNKKNWNLFVISVEPVSSEPK